MSVFFKDIMKSINGKFEISPDPILNASTLNFTSLSTAFLPKGVLKNHIIFFYILE